MVDLKNVTLQDALQFWSGASRTYHPRHFEFRHVISYPMSFSIQTTKQGAPPAMASSASPQKVPSVTVRRKSITSKRLLDEICRQSNFSWAILGRVIIIKPSGSTPGAQP
jgi:hypothetical protein